ALVHVILRRRGLASTYVPPVSVVLARGREGYIEGLTRYRAGDFAAWLEHFGAAAATSAHLARGYLGALERLSQSWRERLRLARAPRADAAAWAVIDVLPAHPILTAPVAAAATGRARAAIHQAMADLESAGILLPLSPARRNRAWEAAGLLDLLAGLEAGDLPPSTPPP
ncbi:MAG TPA: hypothetical protein VF832_19425, partial [Longimicrobiales bacterium]